MREVSSLNHTRWECKYHIVFIPKQNASSIPLKTQGNHLVLPSEMSPIADSLPCHFSNHLKVQYKEMYQDGDRRKAAFLQACLESPRLFIMCFHI